MKQNNRIKTKARIMFTDNKILLRKKKRGPRFREKNMHKNRVKLRCIRLSW